MVATHESINSRFCSVVEIKLSFFLKGGHLRGQALYDKGCVEENSHTNVQYILAHHQQ